MLFALVVLGAGLRLRQWWWDRSLWTDEATIGIQLVRDSYAQLSRPLGGNQGGPIGWLWAEHTSVLVFGSGERSLRLVPLLSGLAVLALSAHLARRYLPPLAGVLVVLALVCTEPSAYYTNEVKQYATDAAVALAILTVSLRLQRSPTTRNLVLWVLGICLALQFSHPAVFVAAGCTAALVLRFAVTDRATALRVGAAAALWLVLFAVDYVLLLRSLTKNDQLEAYWADGFAPRPLRPGTAVRWLGGDLVSLVANPLGLGAAVLVLVLAGLGLLRLLAVRTELGLPLLGIFGAAVLAAVLHLYPLRERLALYLAPLLLLAIAGLLIPPAPMRSWQWRRGQLHWQPTWLQPTRRPAVRVAPVAVVAAVAVALTALLVRPGVATARAVGTPTTHAEIREALSYVAAHQQPGDGLVINLYMGTTAVYYQTKLPVRVTGLEELRKGCDDQTSLAPLFRYRRVWVLTGVPGMVDPLDTPELELAHLSRAAQLTQVRITPAQPPAGIFPTQVGLALATLHSSTTLGPAVGDGRCMHVMLTSL